MSERSETQNGGLPTAIDTVVIGGGQAGLSAGYHLGLKGRPYVILDDQERVGDSWRKRWDSLRLFTPARYDGLPGMPFPGRPGQYPGKDELADYLEAYAAAFDLDVRHGVEVDRLSRPGERFVVSAGAQTIECNNVIVCTGFDNRPHVPALAAELSGEIVQIHSKDYRNPTQLQPGGVLVVGAGNSGAEIALEVAESGHQTWISGRDPGQEPTRAGTIPDRFLTPLLWFAATRIVTMDRSIGRKAREQFLDPPRGIPRGRVSRKDIAAAGIEWVGRTEASQEGMPLLDDGRVLSVANVVWCTGFTPGYDWIDLPIAMRHGIPEQERGVVVDHPGLYFLGMYFMYSLSSPLVGGVGADAGYVVDHLVSTREATLDQPEVRR